LINPRPDGRGYSMTALRACPLTLTSEFFIRHCKTDLDYSSMLLPLRALGLTTSAVSQLVEYCPPLLG